MEKEASLVESKSSKDEKRVRDLVGIYEKPSEMSGNSEASPDSVPSGDVMGDRLPPIPLRKSSLDVKPSPPNVCPKDADNRNTSIERSKSASKFLRSDSSSSFYLKEKKSRNRRPLSLQSTPSAHFYTQDLNSFNSNSFHSEAAKRPAEPSDATAGQAQATPGNCAADAGNAELPGSQASELPSSQACSAELRRRKQQGKTHPLSQLPATSDAGT